MHVVLGYSVRSHSPASTNSKKCAERQWASPPVFITLILSRLLTRLLCRLATNAPPRRPITVRCTAVGLLPLLREEFRLLKLIFHTELRRRAASRRALPCSSSFFSFFSPRILRAPSTDRPETLPHGRNLAVFYNPTPKMRGALPQKNLGAKNMQKFGQFWTTSDFDREYLRNG